MLLNRWVIAFLTVLWTVQLTVLTSWLLCFHPRVISQSSVFDEWAYLLKPEWDSTVYHAAIAVAIIIFLGLNMYVRWHLAVVDLWKQFKDYLIVQMGVTLIMAAALYKVLVYFASHQLASAVLLTVFVLNVIITFNFRRISLYAQTIKAMITDERLRTVFSHSLPWLVTLGLIAAIGIPDIQAVVARNFIGEQFHHNDSFVMGPALSFLAGQQLDVDVISQYGIGFVAIIAHITQWLGGFSYESMMTVLVWATVFYYIAWYWLLRRIIKDPLVLIATMCVMIKWQLLHPATYPLIFTYGSQTPVRFIYDVLFFWILWVYWQKPDLKLLIALASTAGFGIYYFTSEGMYAAAALGGMLVLALCHQPLRIQTRLTTLRVCGVMAVVPGVAFVLLAITIGKDVFSPVFWQNLAEFIQYFTNGFGLQPMTSTLIAKQSLASAVGFLIPLVYLGTLLIIGTRICLGLAPAWQMWIITLCLYGLGTYHYYIARSVVTSYYTVSIPYCIVLGFWCSEILAKLPEKFIRVTRWGLFITAFGALITTHQWISYPNFVNISRNPLVDPLVAQKLPNGQPYFNHLFRDQAPGLLREEDFLSDSELVAYYRQATNFTIDVEMIQELTDPVNEIPIIASFEIELLRQAKRKPFFYYFPLVISHPFEARLVPAVSIYTRTQLKKVIDKLEKVQPKVIFLEKGLANIQLSKELTYRYPTTIELLMYVYQHYELLKEGQYLIALRRR